MVFWYKNFQTNWRKKIVWVIENKLLKFETEGRELANNFVSLDHFIRTIETKTVHQCFNVVTTVKKPFIGYQIDSWMLKYTTASNGILLPKLFSPTVRRNCSSDWENWPRMCKNFEITETIFQTVKGHNNFW